MFTGIVSELGTVLTLGSGSVVRIEIEAPGTCEGLEVGDSVAVNGVCLTAVAIEQARFAVDAVPETMDRTSLGDLELQLFRGNVAGLQGVKNAVRKF